MRIKEPGLYDLSDEDYFSDPCPKPSLTQSLAKTLLNRSPLHMWYEHPRLNPQFVEERDDKMDLGLVAHALVFHKGRNLEVGDFADFRSKAAREWRDKVRATGDFPILAPMHARATSMAARLAEHVEIDASNARAEVTAIAEMKGTWLRTKIDWLSADCLTALDYKTTSQKMSRSGIQDYAFGQGWQLQAAMHARIIDYLRPNTRGKRLHFFLLQETYAPYAVYNCQLTTSMLEHGAMHLDAAISTFKRCLETDTWSGPSQEMLYLGVPNWGLRQWEEEQHGQKISAFPSET